MKVKNIGINSPSNSDRSTNSIGYIFIPQDVDREKYIANCLNTNTVSVINENGQTFHKIPIGKNSINFISFPQNTNQTGSPVLMTNVKPFNRLIIVDVFDSSDQFENREENEFLVTKSNGDNTAQLSLKGKDGRGSLTIRGVRKKSGTFKIFISNSEKNALLDIFVNGDCVVKTNSDIKLEASANIEVNKMLEGEVNSSFKLEEDLITVKSLNVIVESDSVELKSEAIVLSSDDIKASSGDESGVLGDSLEALMDDLITQVSNITVTTLLGPQPIINKPFVEALKPRVAGIKSSKFKLS